MASVRDILRTLSAPQLLQLADVFPAAYLEQVLEGAVEPPLELLRVVAARLGLPLSSLVPHAQKDASRAFAQAVLAQAAASGRQAVVALREAVRAADASGDDTLSAKVRLALARLLTEEEELWEARLLLAECSEFLRRAPCPAELRAELHLEEGRVLRARGEQRAAIEAFREALPHLSPSDPRLPALFCLLARLLLAEGRPAEALHYATKGLALIDEDEPDGRDPSAPDRAAGSPRAADSGNQDTDHRRRREPERWEVRAALHGLAARCLRMLERYPEAYDHMEKALRLYGSETSPRRVRTAHELAVLALELGRPEEAEPLLEEALAHCLTRGWYRLAAEVEADRCRLYLATARRKLALTAWKSGVDLALVAASPAAFGRLLALGLRSGFAGLELLRKCQDILALLPRQGTSDGGGCDDKEASSPASESPVR